MKLAIGMMRGMQNLALDLRTLENIVGLNGALGTLVNLLGHRDINTTRIYTRLSVKIVAAQLFTIQLIA